MLTLEIEWLMGVCFAARDPSDPAPDWPPQPDRIFSALVASWGAHGCDTREREALAWLEAQDPPMVLALDGEARTSVKAYVPVNDQHRPDQAGWRSRQERRFPATRVAEVSQHLIVIWKAAEAGEHFEVLQQLARDTSYIGHSSSMVRCRFVREPVDFSEARASRRAPYAGRLDELVRLHDRHIAGDERARPRPSTRGGAALAAPDWISPFSAEWTVLEHAGGERPDVRGAAAIAKTMRDALMSAWEGSIPEWLSGHAPDGAPSKAPHLAVVPLANIGFEWSDGALMGLALVLPRAVEVDWRTPIPRAWQDHRRFAAAIDSLHVEAGDEACIALTLGRSGVWRLRRAGGMLRQSLRPARYCAEARVWTTATPIALDRHLKADEQEQRLLEAAASIEASCANLSLPKPARVRAHKHAAAQASPSAWPAGGAPAWQNWARAASLKGRPLFHATIEFERPVRGPLLLGAGRFVGLGLCLPAGRSA